MKIGFVIGNGESRKGFDLEHLKKFGPVFGCNALYRTFTPDLLMTRDRHITEEVKGSKYSGLMATYDSAEEKITVWQSPPSTFNVEWGWCAGFMALNLMCKLHKPTTVYMIGFDPYSSPGTEFKNNLYKDTPNYESSREPAETPVRLANKSYRMFFSEATEKFDSIKFVRVGPVEPFPEMLKKLNYPNLELITFAELESRLNQKSPQSRKP